MSSETDRALQEVADAVHSVPDDAIVDELLAGRRIACYAGGREGERADRTVRIAARTMADDRESAAVLPMGSAYEIAVFILVDLITNRVRRRSESVEQLRFRHTNLEQRATSERLADRPGAKGPAMTSVAGPRHR
ncbi:MAG TPA: hypothetical protein VE823_02595 [Geodermatophilus sp.]|jgi:hypothetical protein|nr:hypothetical protein [Geodermatophilus sp.]